MSDTSALRDADVHHADVHDAALAVTPSELVTALNETLADRLTPAQLQKLADDLTGDIVLTADLSVTSGLFAAGVGMRTATGRIFAGGSAHAGFPARWEARGGMVTGSEELLCRESTSFALISDPILPGRTAMPFFDRNGNVLGIFRAITATDDVTRIRGEGRWL